MTDYRNVKGLKLFLYALLHLIKIGKTVSDKKIEENISSGIATYFYNEFGTILDRFAFCPDNIEGINNFYKDKIVSISDRSQKYSCTENDGLFLLIMITFDEIML